jgi:hypothetical protein
MDEHVLKRVKTNETSSTKRSKANRNPILKESLVFDFGLILPDFSNYYAGL